MSGFANSQGGTLLIGVEDNGNIVGVTNAKKLMEDIPNKIVTTTGVVPDVSLLEENGKEYIKITIAPSNTPITYKAGCIIAPVPPYSNSMEWPPRIFRSAKWANPGMSRLLKVRG